MQHAPHDPENGGEARVGRWFESSRRALTDDESNASAVDRGAYAGLTHRAKRVTEFTTNGGIMALAGRENVDAYREAERVRQKNGRAALRRYVLEAKKPGCAKCGEMHPACLQFHHVDPSTKVDTVNRLVAQTKSIAKVMAEIAKCELLCANCHAKEHWGCP